jgi:hypothetical protein
LSDALQTMAPSHAHRSPKPCSHPFLRNGDNERFYTDATKFHPFSLRKPIIPICANLKLI